MYHIRNALMRPRRPKKYCLQLYIYIYIPTQRKVQARNGVIQTRLESKKRKSAIFDQMGHRQAFTSRQKRKTKLHSVPGGKADDHERSFKEHS